jgi:hypothetical protein
MGPRLSHKAHGPLLVTCDASVIRSYHLQIQPLLPCACCGVRGTVLLGCRCRRSSVPYQTPRCQRESCGERRSQAMDSPCAGRLDSRTTHAPAFASMLCVGSNVAVLLIAGCLVSICVPVRVSVRTHDARRRVHRALLWRNTYCTFVVRVAA